MIAADEGRNAASMLRLDRSRLEAELLAVKQTLKEVHSKQHITPVHISLTHTHSRVSSLFTHVYPLSCVLLLLWQQQSCR